MIWEKRELQNGECAPSALNYQTILGRLTECTARQHMGSNTTATPTGCGRNSLNMEEIIIAEA